MDKPEPIFPDGIMFKEPREGAPDFVRGSISIRAKDFIEWMKNNRSLIGHSGWINFDMKLSKKGSMYFQVNTFKPKHETTLTPAEQQFLKERRELAQNIGYEVDTHDIPFN